MSRWIVADTTVVPGAGARAWAVALDDSRRIMAPFNEVAVYDDGGRLLAASPAAFDVLPRVAARLRGGGWRSGDVGLRLAADVDTAGLPYAPARPVARRTVTITNYGWAVQFARDERRLHIGAGTRERALADDVGMNVTVTTDDLDAEAVVAGAVENVGDTAVVAAGYAAEQVAAVRVVFDDGAWLEVPTRDVTEAEPPMSSRVWTVHATREPSTTVRAATHYEALDRQGDIITRVPAS